MDGKEYMANGNKTSNSTEKIQGRAAAHKNEVTHTDFMNFLEPFCEQVSSTKYKELVDPHSKTDLHPGTHAYAKFDRGLKNRLYSCYIFNQKIKIDHINYQDRKELILASQINLSESEIPFFVHKHVLKEFEAEKIHAERAKLEELVSSNKKVRAKIGAAVLERAKPQGYFQVHNLIHRELEGMFKKSMARTRKSHDNFEAEAVEEYLNRMEEFYRVFGDPEQYSTDCYLYPDILDDEFPEDLKKPEFKYLP